MIAQDFCRTAKKAVLTELKHILMQESQLEAKAQSQPPKSSEAPGPHHPPAFSTPKDKKRG